jgi:peptidoglycan hydrolase CwlO-like protein|tara:strand:+ start:643 stop:990 length:348 start_codon:yes stop_codon:yes gene_type:complete
MDWLQNKTTQIIALVGIVGTLAGFGYQGAEYVNRLENLEAKIGGVDEAEDEMKIIEERFASIETSVQFLEKEIDSIEVPDVTDIKTDVATIKAEIQNLQREIDKIEDAEKNPLAG